MTKALSIAELAAIAAEQEDQTVEQTVSFDNEPPPAGATVGRFIEYIEIGKQKQPDYNGKPKPDAECVRLTFELLHPKKNIHEYEVEGEKRVRADRVSIRISKKMSDKAKFKKLFNAMTYGRDSIKHMAQMLGEAFIITIYHNVVEAEGKKRTYVNLDQDGQYGIRAPFIIDPLEETKKDVPVGDPISPLRLFLFNNPTKETWDSLFIDGTREVKKDGGAVEHVSKNWLQELILDASNYSGSALEALLGGVAELPTSEEEVAEQPEEKPVEKKTVATVAKAAAKPAGKPAAAKPSAPAAKKAAPADDALAALGLV
ncbi:hypothetical protein [Bradyrhizobium retamae]|uniref:Uncharacterized protein n=1 Tax=Bradyrhizobium retamae TaxID=1300035 RepID=A0A0R3MQR7_9BRAD|nr:hypothetical protein [Bradyrhizobium retamae]KRR22170.1 hypothetical protein CQ13_30025 [Bradyrhizobium retamae]